MFSSSIAIGRDRRALGETGMPKGGPRVVANGDPSGVMVCVHVEFDDDLGQLVQRQWRRVDSATRCNQLQVRLPDAGAEARGRLSRGSAVSEDFEADRVIR